MALTKVGKEGITGVSNASDATAITIDSSEKVGIGLTSPQELLHLKDGDIVVGNGTASNSSSIGKIGFSTDSSNSRFIGIESFRGGDAANADLRFHTYGGDSDNGERMRIANDGKVGIGTTSPSAKLHVVQGDAALLFTNTFTNVGHTACHFSNSEGSGAYRIRFDSNDTVVGSIGVGTSSTAYNTSSDYRLKENVVYDWDATTRLKQLKPARFNFIIDADKTVDGFLAHEAQAIVPESVTGTKDEVDEDGVAVMQSIDNSKLVPLLVKTIQELEARLTAGGL